MTPPLAYRYTHKSHAIVIENFIIILDELFLSVSMAIFAYIPLSSIMSEVDVFFPFFFSFCFQRADKLQIIPFVIFVFAFGGKNSIFLWLLYDSQRTTRTFDEFDDGTRDLTHQCEFLLKILSHKNVKHACYCSLYRPVENFTFACSIGQPWVCVTPEPVLLIAIFLSFFFYASVFQCFKLNRIAEIKTKEKKMHSLFTRNLDWLIRSIYNFHPENQVSRFP